MTTNRIWIPSIQRYTRMSEISCEQYREILKSIDDDYEFEYTLNNLLIENLHDKKFSLDDITILDRFIILLQLKVYSCGEILSLGRVCEKCGTKTDFNINLNLLLDNFREIDKSFEKVFFHNPNFVIVCDIPSVDWKQECTLTENDDYERKLNLYLYSFIKKLIITNNDISFQKLTFDDKMKICENIPYSLILEIKTDFIDQIHKIFKNLTFVKAPCANQTCKDELELKMNINNITDLCRILFKDSSLTDMLGQYANLSMNCHFDYNFYKNMTPVEIKIISNLLKKNTEIEQEPKTNKDIDLFQEYRLQTEGMVETPSEFM